uniref:Uncharacterized protein n=1 Tax=Brassica oleracea TaxID=3712 RepID=A0A3P6AR36_BRAOL|nr:unnamed protein product [Brassica oleracea]
MMVDKKNRRCVLHVELAKIVSKIESNEMFSMNEENLSDARANDGMVGVGELEIVPHIQEDEFEHEKISEEVPHHSTWESSNFRGNPISGCPPPDMWRKKGRLQVTRFPFAREISEEEKEEVSTIDW